MVFSPRPELRLASGAALILLAACAFGTVAADVVRGAAITRLDVELAQWFHAHATSGLTRAMLLITHCNGLAGTSVMAALLALWFLRRRYDDWLLLTLVAVPGGMLLNVALKHAFHRVRPHVDDPVLQLSTYSFPSGHTAASTVFYGLLACFLVPRLATWPARLLAVAVLAAMVVLVAVSRMVLGVHYLSDVLAATAESCAWLATCFTAAAAWRQRRARAA